MARDPREILKRFSQLEVLRRRYEQHWENIAEFMIPRKRGLIRNLPPGEKLTDSQYDATPTRSGEKLAAFIHGALTSTAYPFFGLQTRNVAAMDIKTIADWLETCGERMLRAFSQSNWDSECPESYIDNIFFGTAAPMFTAEKRIRTSGSYFGGLHFTAIPLAEAWCDENEEGVIDTLYWKYCLSARAIVSLWGNKVSPQTKNLADSKPYDPMEILLAIEPRKEGVSRNRDAYSWELPYSCTYVDVKNAMILEEKGFHEFPAPAPRWNKSNSDRVYGRGPGDTAYPDARTLNESVRLKLMSLALAVFPPFMKDSGFAGSIRWLPGAEHVVNGKALGMSPPIQPILNGAKFDVAEVEEAKCREMIEAAFYSPLLQLPENGPQMTAREAMIRLRLLQQILGPTLGRFKSEFLDPVISRVFGIMMRAGALPPPPDELLALQGTDAEIDIVYKGPLAMAQRSDDTIAIEGQVEYIVNLFKETGDPSVLDPIDLDEATWARADVSSVPSKIMRGREQVEKIRQQRAEEKAQEAAAAERERSAQEAATAARAQKDLAAAGASGGEGA